MHLLINEISFSFWNQAFSLNLFCVIVAPFLVPYVYVAVYNAM